MGIKCGQTVTPTTDETPLECEEFTPDRCIYHEEAIAYLSLGTNTSYEVLIEALVMSLRDTRNRLQQLDSNASSSVNIIETTSHTLSNMDTGGTLIIENNSSTIVIIPDDSSSSFFVGAEVTVVNIGSVNTTIQPVGTAVVIANNLGTSVPQGESRTLLKVDDNTWLIKY